MLRLLYLLIFGKILKHNLIWEMGGRRSRLLPGYYHSILDSCNNCTLKFFELPSWLTDETCPTRKRGCCILDCPDTEGTPKQWLLNLYTLLLSSCRQQFSSRFLLMGLEGHCTEGGNSQQEKSRLEGTGESKWAIHQPFFSFFFLFKS